MIKDKKKTNKKETKDFKMHFSKKIYKSPKKKERKDVQHH